jgi:hypothetical protein
MKPKVYVETTIVSYLTARPTRDVVTAAMIQQTNDWWARRRELYELFVAEPVIREASRGDNDAARRRMEVLHKLSVLIVTGGWLAVSSLISPCLPVPRMTLSMLASRQHMEWNICSLGTVSTLRMREHGLSLKRFVCLRVFVVHRSAHRLN